VRFAVIVVGVEVEAQSALGKALKRRVFVPTSSASETFID